MQYCPVFCRNDQDQFGKSSCDQDRVIFNSTVCNLIDIQQILGDTFCQNRQAEKIRKPKDIITVP